MELKPGKILIAQPFMEDPNFKRSVICLCDHDSKEGTVGFILNKPINIDLKDLVSDIETNQEFNVYYGGPVSTDTIHYVHNVGELLEESIEVTKGVYWSGNFDKLKFLINSELIKPANIRFYVGYSGWSKNQLAEEMKTGSWMLSDVDPNYIFKSKASKLWGLALTNKGNRYSVIAQIPNASSSN